MSSRAVLLQVEVVPERETLTHYYPLILLYQDTSLFNQVRPSVCPAAEFFTLLVMDGRPSPWINGG